MSKADFYIFKRSPKNKKCKPIYYCQFRDKDGKLSSALSTGQTSRATATSWVLSFLRKGGYVPSSGKLTFGEYAQDWWTSACPYCRSRKARGFSFSDKYIELQRGNLTRHVLPTFGDVKLNEITVKMIDDWVLGWYERKSHAPGTVNKSLGCLKLMLSEATRLQLINGNPATAVPDLKETPKTKGTLSLGEIKQLFDDSTIDKIWSSRYYYAANFLACSTGMRLGEVQGLKRKYVHDGYVEIEEAFNGKFGMSAPKWGSCGPVVIPSKVAKALREVMENSPYKMDDDLVFAAHAADKPYSKTVFLLQYKSSLTKIGIPTEQIKERNLTFHSWRHGLNSLMRGRAGIGDEMVRRMMRHKTPEMTNRYDHVSPELLAPIQEAQEMIFNGI